MPGRSKRQLQLEAAREAKHQRKEEEDSQPEADLLPSENESAPASATDVPGPTTVTSDDPGPSNVSTDETPVDVSDLVEEYTRDWIEGLDRDDLMSLSIALHHLLVTMLQLKKTDASKLIAELTGKGERTVREWRATFTTNNGSFPDTLQGKY